MDGMDGQEYKGYFLRNPDCFCRVSFSKKNHCLIIQTLKSSASVITVKIQHDTNVTISKENPEKQQNIQ